MSSHRVRFLFVADDMIPYGGESKELIFREGWHPTDDVLKEFTVRVNNIAGPDLEYVSPRLLRFKRRTRQKMDDVLREFTRRVKNAGGVI